MNAMVAFAAAAKAAKAENFRRAIIVHGSWNRRDLTRIIGIRRGSGEDIE